MHNKHILRLWTSFYILNLIYNIVIENLYFFFIENFNH